jgi:hypothetical protein
MDMGCLLFELLGSSDDEVEVVEKFKEAGRPGGLYITCLQVKGSCIALAKTGQPLLN